MKKIIPLLIVGLLILMGLEAGAIPIFGISEIQPKQTSVNPCTYHEELDQSMTSYDGVLPLGRTNISGFYANLSAAQSFTPQKELLLRAQFLMGRNITTTYPCWLAVRDNLTHTDLTVVSVDSSHFPVVNGTPTEQQLAWVDFNFTPIWVTHNHTYYMVLYTANITNNYYWISGNGSNIYLNGTVYLSINDGHNWSEFVNADACFKTYGLRETFLQITLSGNLFGPSWVIKNIGNATAWNVSASIIVKGGLLGRINKTFSTSPFPLDLSPGNQTILKMGFLFGFGKITITIDVKAENVKEIEQTVEATIILFFIVGIK
jgi:hypothetical protein